MDKLWSKLKKEQYRVPFLAAVVIGFLTHFYMLVNKFPNSDSMTNFYFDQNMVTSGRWFLTVACGISSFYDLNWIIGVLSILYLAIAAVLLCEFFEVQSNTVRILISGLLVTFPAITATFSYMYTMDGYMLALILSILAAWLTKKYKWGFALGGIALAFSMGTYQAYLAVTILLGMLALILMLLQNRPIKDILGQVWRYLVMGMEGGALYYIILKICLAAQGKVLDTYQGIDSMGKISFSKLPEMLYNAYYDFAAFAVKGNIFVNNGFSAAGMILLIVAALVAAIFCFVSNRTYRKWYQMVLMLVLVVLLPLGTNIILLISSEAYYHLLMRLQWILFPIFCVVLTESGFNRYLAGKSKKNWKAITAMIGCAAGGILIFNFMITDNIAYFNMNERYEKTYAYCLRLIDRMEQTPGYETGMPVAMIGVVNEEAYPNTDITQEVTARISGTTGTMVVYKGEQYAAFMKHYMNFTMNPIIGDQMIEIYDSPEYQEMGTFPASDSIRIVDGIMYIKTE